MSLPKLSLFMLSFVLFSCALKSHKAEESLLKTDTGSTQVKIKLDKKESASVGAEIEAFDKICKETMKMRVRTQSCELRRIGSGKVIQVLGENTYNVEFDATVPVNAITEYEIKNK